MRGAFIFLLPVMLSAQISLLRVRAIGDDGAGHAAGSRSAGIVVEAADELGKPVPGAVITVRLPDDGPGGSFATGLSSSIVTTGADGRATTAPITWNRLVGAVEIRITAISGRLRAGTIATCRLSEPEPIKQAAAEPETHGARVILKSNASSGGGHLKWILIGAAAAGAAATCGLVVGRSHSAQQSAGGSSATGAVISISAHGPPTIVNPNP